MVLTSTAVILVIIGLLYAYELSVHLAKHYLPPQLLPVLNVMLAEIAGLGFIGLLLQIAEGYFAHSIEMMSELSFGEEEALVEAFEWFHNKFFEVATIFCIFGGGMLFYLDEMKVAFERIDADGDGYISAAELGELMAAVDSPKTEEEVGAMMKRIEDEQTIKKRDAEGGSLIYVERWAKVMNDMTREVALGKKTESAGFKFPWDK